MKKVLFILCVVILTSTIGHASEVGLQVGGNAGFIFKPGGSAQWLDSAPSYHTETYNQSSYGILTGQTEKNWKGTWQDSQGNIAEYDGKGTSSAKAYFGSLGVNSYAWVSDRTAGINAPYNYWDWSTNSSATAAFSDSWKVDAAGLAGTIGILSVDVDLSGLRTANSDNRNSVLYLTLYDYTTKGRADLGPDVTAGHYVLSIPFLYGSDNDVMMSLVGGAGSFNQYPDGTGGESFVDFYNTANILGLTFYDANGVKITDYAMTAGSGHDYNGTPVPGPITAWLLGSGLVGLIGIRRQFKKERR